MGVRNTKNTATAVAQTLEQEILALNWPVGHTLGSEAQLSQRLGVSSPTMRAAIRLLESRSLVEVRRGAGGGVFVIEPTAQTTADNAALYLRYHEVTSSDVRLVRQALELAAVAAATERMSSSTARNLKAAIAAEQEAARTSTPGERRAHCHLGFHQAIAEISGNPAMSIFIDIVSSVVRRRYNEDDVSLSEEMEQHIVNDHATILEAMCRGDVGRATREMQLHLEFIYEATKQG